MILILLFYIFEMVAIKKKRERGGIDGWKTGRQVMTN